MCGRSYHLVSKQQDSLKAELARTEVEKVLETRSKKLHYHDVVVSFSATPLDCRNSDLTYEKQNYYSIINVFHLQLNSFICSNITIDNSKNFTQSKTFDR